MTVRQQPIHHTNHHKSSGDPGGPSEGAQKCAQKCVPHRNVPGKHGPDIVAWQHSWLSESRDVRFTVSRASLFLVPSLQEGQRQARLAPDAADWLRSRFSAARMVFEPMQTCLRNWQHPGDSERWRSWAASKGASSWPVRSVGCGPRHRQSR